MFTLSAAQMIMITDLVLILASKIASINWGELSSEEVAALKQRKEQLEQISDMLVAKLNELQKQYGEIQKL